MAGNAPFLPIKLAGGIVLQLLLQAKAGMVTENKTTWVLTLPQAARVSVRRRLLFSCQIAAVLLAVLQSLRVDPVPYVLHNRGRVKG